MKTIVLKLAVLIVAPFVGFYGTTYYLNHAYWPDHETASIVLTNPEPVPTLDSDLARWGYHRDGDKIVINDDWLTLKPDGTLWDSHGDYVGRLKGKP